MLKKKHVLSENHTARIVKNILEGVNYLHSKHYIHKNLWPENILFDNKTVKIIDFYSCVQDLNKNFNSHKKFIDDKPYYVSPEQI